jgi:hypothetical protein
MSVPQTERLNHQLLPNDANLPIDMMAAAGPPGRQKSMKGFVLFR